MENINKIIGCKNHLKEKLLIYLTDDANHAINGDLTK